MRKIFLHLGYPKTGTSSIQVFHRENAEVLAGLGFYVPALGRGHHGAHHTLTRTLAGQPLPPHAALSEADIIGELAEAPADSILISSEMLTGVLANAAPAQRLLGCLRATGARIILVMYVRNQTQMLNSNYSQQVKSFRGRGDFGAHVARALATGAAYGYAKWLEIAERHGLELRARPFSEQVRKEGVIADYLKTVGCPCGESLVMPARLNESAGPFTVEAALRLQHWAAERFGPFTMQQADLSKRMLREAVEAAAIEEPRYCGLDDPQARDIELAFKENNDRFAQAMWRSDWQSVFGGDIGQHFEPNDYRRTGVPPAMRQRLRDLMAALRPEIKAMLKRPRFAVREAWTRLPA